MIQRLHQRRDRALNRMHLNRMHPNDWDRLPHRAQLREWFRQREQYLWIVYDEGAD